MGGGLSTEPRTVTVQTAEGEAEVTVSSVLVWGQD